MLCHCILYVGHFFIFLVSINVTSDMGADFRIATITGHPDACHRAQKMVEDIVAEVGPVSKYCHYNLIAVLTSQYITTS